MRASTGFTIALVIVSGLYKIIYDYFDTLGQKYIQLIKSKRFHLQKEAVLYNQALKVDLAEKNSKVSHSGPGSCERRF